MDKYQFRALWYLIIAVIFAVMDNGATHPISKIIDLFGTSVCVAISAIHWGKSEGAK